LLLSLIHILKEKSSEEFSFLSLLIPTWFLFSLTLCINQIYVFRVNIVESPIHPL
jgi:hypothetical protein